MRTRLRHDAVPPAKCDRSIAHAHHHGPYESARRAGPARVAPRTPPERRLNQLGRRAAERLAWHVLGPGADAPTIARIVALSEGNAFYLEELIRWKAEGRGHGLRAKVVAMASRG
ncbi:hypothetical protein WMF30_33250 [Sorangium sp. So ce134]